MISRQEQKIMSGLNRQELNETVAGSRGRLSHWMEEVIREAEERGDFADLPGKGKPLHLKNRDPFGGLEADLYGALKQAGFTPEWVELRKKIIAEITWLQEPGKHTERAVRIVETNIMIDRHNRCIPTPSLTLPKLPRDFGL